VSEDELAAALEGIVSFLAIRPLATAVVDLE
jgi:hypothetical protein